MHLLPRLSEKFRLGTQLQGEALLIPRPGRLAVLAKPRSVAVEFALVVISEKAAKDVLSASLSHNYTNGYLDATERAEVGKPTYPAIRKVDAYATFDATLGWRAMTGLNIGLGIENLLDQDPPSSRSGAHFQTGYEATFTNPLGRTFYLRATCKFL